MRRREFITLIGGVAAWPVAVRAQRPTLPTIGWLGGSPTDVFSDRFASYRRGLNEAGYVEGQNVTFEYRWADGQYDRLPALAADLVRRRVAVIVALGSGPAALAAKAATQTIPIVFDVGFDPVENGLVATLSHPAGNLTGVVRLNAEVAAKRVSLLHEVTPTATSIGLLVNPTAGFNADTQTKALQAGARALGLTSLVLNASDMSGIESAFATLAQERAGGLVVSGDPFFTGQNDKVAALAARYAVPAVYSWRVFTNAGGLMSYGPNLFDTDHQIGIYTGRILKGERPADLPVIQSTRFELVVNLKTAKTLGLTVPPTLLAIADEVIE
jgi:putative tryptophan/tyrosine transport system substrate-binding protein